MAATVATPSAIDAVTRTMGSITNFSLSASGLLAASTAAIVVSVARNP
jgi:hypothetical protein